MGGGNQLSASNIFDFSFFFLLKVPASSPLHSAEDDTSS